MLRLAWRNLWRQPRRTWLTMGAMIFCNILLVFMMSFQFGWYDLMIRNTLEAFTGHVQVQAPGYVDDKKMRQVVPNVAALAGQLREQLDLDRVAARAEASALVSSVDRTYGIGVVGVQPAFEPAVSSIPGLIKRGHYLDDAAAAEIVIGSVLARNLRADLGDELTLLGSGVDGSFAAAVATIVGIFESGVPDVDRSVAEIPLQFFQDTFFMQGGGHQVVIVGSDVDAAAVLAAQVESLLPADADLVVHDWQALQPGLKQAIQADIGSSFFMYFILVVLVAFSVLNTQLMSVLERTREFGIVMALGLKPGRLGRLVILETALMGAMGTAIGIAIGAALTSWAGVVGLTIPGMEEMAARFNLPSVMHPRLSVLSIVTGPSVVFVFTLIAAIYPALRLRWLQPVEAMRAV